MRSGLIAVQTRMDEEGRVHRPQTPPKGHGSMSFTHVSLVSLYPYGTCWGNQVGP